EHGADGSGLQVIAADGDVGSGKAVGCEEARGHARLVGHDNSEVVASGRFQACGNGPGAKARDEEINGRIGHGRVWARRRSEFWGDSATTKTSMRSPGRISRNSLRACKRTESTCVRKDSTRD